jgi:putative nucleotidyltransferase with HDIG domain
VPGLKQSVRIYVLAVGISGIAFLLGSWMLVPITLDQTLLVTTALTFAINAASERYVIKLPRGGELVASTISQIACIFILPLPLAVTIVAISAAMGDILSRKAWYKVLFNASQMLLAVGIPTMLLRSIASPGDLLSVGNAAHGMPLTLGAVVAYYVINTILTNAIIALDRRSSILDVWLANNATSVLLEFGMGIIGVLWAYIWLLDPFWSLLTVLPAVMTCRAFSHIRKLEDENEEGVLAIADMIDARDPYTFQHSKRVAEYVEKIAETMLLGTRHVEILTSAARLHDLGKIGISNEVLHKASALTEAERSVMQKHPEIGASILSRYRDYRDGLVCVLHHHERYDGRGYPYGLKGEDIPLGARIMAVADSYEAMTSDRPYRKALGREVAIGQLKAGMGTQFDPMVVAAFLKVLHQEEHEHERRLLRLDAHKRHQVGAAAGDTPFAEAIASQAR